MTHDHADHGDETLEQLLTVGICGAFGVVGTLLGWQAVSRGDGMLKLLLAKPFWIWVLWGGSVLLVMTTIRGVALWRAAGVGKQVHVHDHDHADCGHDHAPDCGHDHAPGEEHAHGGVFWRAVVLLFPIVLFFMGLPNAGFSKDRINNMLGQDVDLGADHLKDVVAKGGIVTGFEEIAKAIRDPELMKAREGQLATIRGQFRKIGDREFTLFTLKQTCCAADMVPLKARIVIIADENGGSLSSKALADGEWIEVTGILQFVLVPGKSEYLPVVRAKLADISRTTPDL